MKRILIVEDDAAIQAGLYGALVESGFEPELSSDGISGYNTAKTCVHDLIILDIMLPGMNGLDICRNLRAEGYAIPIIILTSKNEEIDKVLGLELGADDYLTKPFSIRELVARVKALLRRVPAVSESPKADIIEFADIRIDLKKMEALKSGHPLELSVREFQILKYFAEHEGEVVQRDNLLDNVWGYDNYPTTRTVDNYILSLRKSLEDDPSHPEHIITVHTLGYKFIR